MGKKMLDIIKRHEATKHTLRYTLPEEYSLGEGEAFIEFTVKQGFGTTPAFRKASLKLPTVTDKSTIEQQAEYLKQFLNLLLTHAVVSWNTTITADGVPLQPTPENLKVLVETEGLPSLSEAFSKFTMEAMKFANYENRDLTREKKS